MDSVDTGDDTQKAAEPQGGLKLSPDLIEEIAKAPADAVPFTAQELEDLGISEEIAKARAALAARQVDGPPPEVATQAGPPSEDQPEHQAATPSGGPKSDPNKLIAESALAVMLSENARLRAEIEQLRAARETSAPSAQSARPEPKTLEQELSELEKKFDDGEITLAQFALKSYEIQRRHEPSPEVPQAPPARPTQSLALQERTEQLRRENPWIDKIDPDIDLPWLAGHAKKLFEQRGYVADGSELADFLFRQCVVDVGRHFGLPERYGAPAAQPSAPASAPRVQPPPPPPPTARQMVDPARRQPPDVASIGAAPGSQNMDALLKMIETMSARDLAGKLPQSQIDALAAHFLH